MNVIDWQPIEPIPEKKTILRWHIMWKVPMALKYLPNQGFQDHNGNSLDWVEASYTLAWPEEAFTPHWAELPQPPPKIEVYADAIKAPKIKKLCLDAEAKEKQK